MTVDLVDRQQVRHGLEEVVRRAAVAARRLAGLPLDELSVVLLDDAGIRPLNRRLLGHDWPTDVIAFEAEADPDDALRAEIYVNVQAAERQAPEYGHTFEEELCFLVAHGVLHALGQDDADEAAREAMFELQAQAVREALA
jgi:probable rRNA maturation factor